ncbi:MAG: F0F1 ATP synthase subunit B [Bacteroidetes bacterium]|nr:MAG: F0F1 ATP synthase subunit B [Bacteroidota bacterium]
MLDINPGLIIWTLVTFALLVLVLGRFAWKPLLQTLQTREQEIADALRKAEEAKKDAERMIQENKATMDKAAAETARLIAEGRAMAEQVKGDIVARANESARKMLEQAKDEIAREKDAAVQQLRGEVADLAVSAAEKILDETLDGARQKKLIDKALQQLPKN